MSDDDETVRLTYAELAQARGITLRARLHLREAATPEPRNSKTRLEGRVLHSPANRKL
jgi:hypothetical protein